MIKSSLHAVSIQRAFRCVHVSCCTEIAVEFSFVGIQGAVKERSDELHLGAQFALRQIHHPFLTKGQALSLSERNASSPGITARSL